MKIVKHKLSAPKLKNTVCHLSFNLWKKCKDNSFIFFKSTAISHLTASFFLCSIAFPPPRVYYLFCTHHSSSSPSVDHTDSSSPVIMGSLWRSQPMQLVQLFVQVEAAHETVDELGQLGVIQFRDVCSFCFFILF